MPRETIHLETEGPMAHLSAIVFLAVLAYPSELEKREKFTEAARAWMVKKWIEQGEREIIREVAPKHLYNYQGRAIDNKFKQVVRRISERRIDAARLAQELSNSVSPYFGTASKDAVRGTRKKPGLNTAIDLLTTEIKSKGADDTTNVRQRIWVESKPVIHLATAFWEKFKLEGGAAPQRLIAYPHLWLRETLSHAEFYRGLFLITQPFKITPDEMVALIPSAELDPLPWTIRLLNQSLSRAIVSR